MGRSTFNRAIRAGWDKVNVVILNKKNIALVPAYVCCLDTHHDFAADQQCLCFSYFFLFLIVNDLFCIRYANMNENIILINDLFSLIADFASENP